MIKFEHTIFALPFAYIGMVMGFKSGFSFKVFLLVSIAMASARSAAMALNRIIDRKYDALNERTKNREIPAGKIKLSQAYIFTAISIVIFEVSTYFINDLAFRLSPIALFFVITYSYTKRFSLLCHLYLGATDAIAPLGGYVAAAGELTEPIWFLAIFVMFWIAGFDVLYALQDERFDREHGLHSIPVRFGTKGALFAAKLFHGIGFVFLILSIAEFGLSWIAYAGAIVVLGLLVVEHLLVDPNDPKKINIAFFNINSYISLVLLFAFVLGRYCCG
ncbi:4-hydroxybenzoate octaprenyltransferase [Hippea sp. KM1]|uniref:4-hydroxybenzoate octaprenyltransferase n=1 Tax=Hippea sp. KM1 TaxID=944481 RepID=UPI001E6257A3|nr:4-hydroxybenzoate octaprenyltransferase [Hippea sp. KM1]